MSDIKIPHQLEFRQGFPYVIKAHKDYTEYRELLETMAIVLRNSDIEEELAEYFHLQAYAKAKAEGIRLRKEVTDYYEHAAQVIRLVMSRKLTQESLRDFACHVAESIVLQQFCLLIRFGQTEVWIPSKSTLQEYEQSIPAHMVKKLNALLLQKVSNPDETVDHCGLEERMDLSECYIDTTCLEAHIHYPVDWVLFKDAVRSLMQAIETIRKRGLKNRMEESPAQFISRMNILCMKMSYARRQKESKKKRKAFFRQMKKLLKKVSGHAQRHHTLLAECWQQIDVGEGEKDQILLRIDRVLEQLPKVLTQAHTRIISERKVAHHDKILSLYDGDIEVVVRKKSGKEVEFGNVLSLLESKDGLILDGELYKRKLSDVGVLKDRVEAVERCFGEEALKSITGDRGFFSAGNKKYLDRKKIIDYTCPRNPQELSERTKEEDGFFIVHQKRRAQTEGRIGIFKNVFLGSPFRNKGFDSRETGVQWAILAHNVWVIARKIVEEKKHEGKSMLRKVA